jgi:hypothetical protein
LLGLYFLARALTSRPGAGRSRDAGRGHCPAPLFHLLMYATMVWMALAMPLLMPGRAVGDGGADVDGMVMGSASSGAAGATPSWLGAIAGPVSTAVALARLVAGGYWLRRALADRPLIRPVPAAVGSPVGTPGAAPLRDPAGAAPSAGGPSAGVGRENPAIRWLTPRGDALCHLAMCLGMATTFPLIR